MVELGTKEKLVAAAIKLLEKTEPPSKVTARAIAKESGVNLAMINYFFASKDELVNLAIQEIIERHEHHFKQGLTEDSLPKERLYQVLNFYCDLSIQFQRYLPLTVPYNLLTNQVGVSVDLLTIIEEFYEHRIPTQYCRIIALQMTSFTELFFLRAADFKVYSGIDIYDRLQREQYLRFQIELFLQDKTE